VVVAEAAEAGTEAVPACRWLSAHVLNASRYARACTREGC